MDWFLSACGWVVYSGFLLGTVMWLVASFIAAGTVGLTFPTLWNLFSSCLTLYSCVALLILKLSWMFGWQRGMHLLTFSLLIVLGPVLLGLSLLGSEIGAAAYEPVCGAFFEDSALMANILVSSLFIVSCTATVFLVVYGYFECVWWSQLSDLHESLQPLEYIVADDKSEGPCSICRDQFSADQELGRLRRCEHEFHKRCIEEWIAYDSRCPNCRMNI